MSEVNEEFNKAREAHLQVWATDPADRALYGHAFRSGWNARTVTDDDVRAFLRRQNYALINREELARLQRKAGEGPMVLP